VIGAKNTNRSSGKNPTQETLHFLISDAPLFEKVRSAFASFPKNAKWGNPIFRVEVRGKMEKLSSTSFSPSSPRTLWAKAEHRLRCILRPFGMGDFLDRYVVR